MERDPRAFRGFLPPLAATVDGFSFTLKNDAGTSNHFLMALAVRPGHRSKPATTTPRPRPRRSRFPAKLPGNSRRRATATGTPSAPRRARSSPSTLSANGIGSPVDLFYALYNENGHAGYRAGREHRHHGQPALHTHRRSAHLSSERARGRRLQDHDLEQIRQRAVRASLRLHAPHRAGDARLHAGGHAASPAQPRFGRGQSVEQPGLLGLRVPAGRLHRRHHAERRQAAARPQDCCRR